MSEVRARLDSKSYLGLHLAAGFVVAAIALWLFGALLDAVLDDATLVRWDVATAAAVHGRVTPAGLTAFDAITQLGSPVVLGAIGAIGLVVLWRRRRRTMLIAWAATFAGDALLAAVLKRAVHRTRPAYGAGYLHGHSFSFPSAHAMGSIAAYGVLAYALTRRPGRVPRWAIYAAAALVVLLVGVSRVYLGVHYPSDVLGGFAAGAAWLAVCLTGEGIARNRADDGGPAAGAPGAAR